MARMTRVMFLAVGLTLSLVPARADAQKLSIFLSSVDAERGAAVCTPTNCSPANVIIPGLPFVPGILTGRHVCVGSGLADTGPTYRCSVFVAASLSGRAVAKDVPVKVALEVTSVDGAPWSDEVRRALRGQAALTRSPANGVPAPCSALPAPEPRVSCVRVGPRTWKVSATTKSRTGLYSQPLHIEFPSSTGTEPSCEHLRVKGTATSAGQTAKLDLGLRRFCA